jgi:hypothetical protein
MSHTILTTSLRKVLVTFLLALPLTLAIATPAFADGIFPFTGKIKPGEEVCLGPSFTEDPATDRVVVLDNASSPPASAPLLWTIHRGTTSAMADAVVVLQQTGTSVHLLVTATDFPNLFPGWFNGCIKNTNTRGRPIDVPQAFFTVMVPA